MRERMYTLIQKAELHDKYSKLYDYYIVLVAICSLVPLMFKSGDQIPVLKVMDNVTVYLLFLDYIMRWICCDFSSNKKGIKAFFIYPFTGYAIIDMLSMLPSLGVLGPQFRILRVLRIVKIFHYSKNFVFISNVFKKERKTLGSVLAIAVAYIFVSALAMFTYEQSSFDDFFGALYWATTALTTVGYGDVYPVSDVGRLISMVSSLFGIAVIALPAGIVTGGFLEEIAKEKEEKEKTEQEYLEKQKMQETYQKTTKDYSCLKKYATLMILGVLINEVLGTITTILKLPIWLDTVGTVLVTLLLEPAAGLLVGLANNFYLSIMYQDNTTLFYYLISAGVVLAISLVLLDKGKINTKRIIPTVVVVAIISTVLSACLGMWRTGGVPTGDWEQYFYNMALGNGMPNWVACVFGIGIIKVLDTIAVALISAASYIGYKKLQKRKDEQ